MSPPRPTLAHQAGVIATIILWTLLALVASTLVPALNGSNSRFPVPPRSLVSQVSELGPETLLFASTALLSSLILVRFVPIRQLWHAAILAVTAYLLVLLFFRSYVMEWLLAFRFYDPPLDELAWLDLGLCGVIHIAQITILFYAYRLIGRRLSRGRSETLPVEPPPGEARGTWGGTRAEWKALSILLACLALFVVGGFFTVRELQLRQIPAPVWALLRESRDLEILTLEDTFNYYNRTTATANDIYGESLTGRVSASTPRERAAVTSWLRRALIGSASTRALQAGSPTRHPNSWAIRVSSDTKTYDLLVTLIGWQMILILYDGDDAVRTIPLFAPPDELTPYFKPSRPQP